MSELYRLCGAAIIALCAVFVLRQTGSQGAELVTVFFGVLAVSHMALRLEQTVRQLAALAQGSSVDGYFKLLLKAAGMAFVTDITSELCRSASAPSLGTYVELFGRCEILLCALPLAGELLELCFGLLRV